MTERHKSAEDNPYGIFEIQPYSGAGPLGFGMTQIDVLALGLRPLHQKKIPGPSQIGVLVHTRFGSVPQMAYSARSDFRNNPLLDSKASTFSRTTTHSKGSS